MRVKTNLFSVFILLLALSFITCSDNDKESNIKLEETSLNLDMESNREVYINITGGSGSYAAYVSRPEVADAEIVTKEGVHSLLIRIKMAGSTNITVEDNNTGKKEDLLLTVTGPDSGKIVQIEHIVDADLKEVIEADLQKNDPYPVGSVYWISKLNQLSGKYVVTSADHVEVASGTLSMVDMGGNALPEVYDELLDGKHIYSYQKWKMNSGGKELDYDMFFISGLATRMVNKPVYHLRLYENLTDYYKVKYPDAGVNKVFRVQICEYTSN